MRKLIPAQRGCAVTEEDIVQVEKETEINV